MVNLKASSTHTKVTVKPKASWIHFSGGDWRHLCARMTQRTLNFCRHVFLYRLRLVGAFILLTVAFLSIQVVYSLLFGWDQLSSVDVIVPRAQVSLQLSALEELQVINSSRVTAAGASIIFPKSVFVEGG